MHRFVLATIVLAGCGGSEPSNPTPDAPVVPVVALASCPATVAATVMDSATAFVPMSTTISAGGTVKFVITAEHFVLPNTLVNTDQALRVSRGETKCLQFNAPGTYGFLCGVHSFTGTITVQ